jgi:sRNA-binding regulator protein Hfq
LEGVLFYTDTSHYQADQEDRKLNRKLIRPKLTEVNLRQIEPPRSANPVKNITNGHSNYSKPAQNIAKPNNNNQQTQKKSPPQDTNAEIFYYKKQIEGHVPMIIILQDGEKVSGTIEWYDRHALKINRDGEPNIMLLKHNIKYMYKDPEKN